MNLCAVAFSSARLRRSLLWLCLFSYLLAMFFPQTVSTLSSCFAWNGPVFFQAQAQAAQPRLAVYILQTSSGQSRAHNHLLMSAVINSPIDPAGLRLVSVLSDQI
jgi:hypothetical protein